MEGERQLTWEERLNLCTEEQRRGKIKNKFGWALDFGYISPFTEKLIHYWLDCYDIPRTIKI